MRQHNMSNMLYVYEISSNAPRECEDVPTSVAEGVVFVTTGLDPGVDDDDDDVDDVRTM
jgi:hypothetical protein